MNFDYSKAPMYYLEGVAAYKAGEWPGKMPCKFGPTRKVIRPSTEGIIFNEHEPLAAPKRKIYSQVPTKEQEFRPCLKMVKPEQDHRSKMESIKVIRPAIAEGKGRPEKRHYFKYKQQYIQETQNKIKNSDNKLMLNEEFKVLNRIGFSKRTLDSLPNNKLLSLDLTKERGHSNSQRNIPLGAKTAWQAKEQELLNNFRQEKENMKRDADYVKTLENWEKGFLPKIN